MSLMAEYYDWLCDKIDFDPARYDMESVCAQLMISPFVANLKEDENLIESALYLRRTFIRGYDTDDKREFYKALGPCSVFEVINILLDQMSYSLLGNPLASSNQGALFLELMDNLGLGWINDKAYSNAPEECTEYIEDVVSAFVNRTYDVDGNNGSLFPLENPRSDMRDLPLYQQLDAYLIERYDALN